MLVILSVLWIPVITSFKNPQLFLYIQAISSYLSPPMTAVFIMALIWHRMTEPVKFLLYHVLFSTVLLRITLCRVRGPSGA